MSDRDRAFATPMSQADLMARDNIYPAEDRRPFGTQTQGARSFWLENGQKGQGTAKIIRSPLAKGALELTCDAPIHFGLPLQSMIHGESAPATGKERSFDSIESHVPEGVPVAYHPKIFVPDKRRRGRHESDENHSTIFGADSRHYIYPDAYPYCAICKLNKETQVRPGDRWGDPRGATGFLVGRRILITAGHVHPDPGAHAWRIEVIPACWEGQSVFGARYRTYVRSCRWWGSDDCGNDLMICELYDPIGDQLGYFGAVTYDSDWEWESRWIMCGYHSDRSSVLPSREVQITVRDDDDGDGVVLKIPGLPKTFPFPLVFDTTQIENDADEASGASGSPLFGWFDKGPMAIGVHRGVENDETIEGIESWSCASGGSGFVQMIKLARMEWD
jgi:hypothetical protein